MIKIDLIEILQSHEIYYDPDEKHYWHQFKIIDKNNNICATGHILTMALNDFIQKKYKDPIRKQRYKREIEK